MKRHTKKRAAFPAAPILILCILLGCWVPTTIFAKDSVLYSGGPLYDEMATYGDAVRDSGFTTVVLWTIHVYSDGDLVFNDVTLVDDGSYVADADWPDELAALKTGGSVERIEIAIGSYGVSDFETIESLIDSEGTDSDSILYQNFLALKNAVPAIDAISFDDESNYDVDSSVSLALMLNDIGFQVTLCPYTYASFWSSLYSNVESERSGVIDRVDLQCYSGGSANDPDTWNDYFDGLQVTPGLWCYSNGQSPSQVQSQMTEWNLTDNIAGGFIWLLDDMVSYLDTYPIANYAAAINQAMTVQSTSHTVAYWRFEAGPEEAQVAHVSDSEGTYSADIPDVSGNGNDLSAWSSASDPGYVYRSDVGSSTIPLTGAANTMSVKNSGSDPSMFCDTLQDWTPSQWTVEVTCKLESGWYKTIIGRDSYGTATTNADLSAFYLQVVPNQALAVKYCDVAGYWHEAVSDEYVYSGFDYSTNPDGEGVSWYSMAASCDGNTLSLYLYELGADTDYTLIAQTDLTDSGSSDTTLTAGDGSGSDWQAGDWSVGRGLYGGAHGDRAYGFIDEIRFSDAALSPAEFLFSPVYENTVAYWRFEDGTADATVEHGDLEEGEYYPSVLDVTGKGNNLSVWSESLGAFTYRQDVAAATVPLTGQDNDLSIQNADDSPSLFTSSEDAYPVMMDIETWQPEAFTIEASFKPDGSDYRTIIGRDAYNVIDSEVGLAALYFQILPDDGVAIKFADVDGYWHTAVSDSDLIQYSVDGYWYHMAAVCDGSTLSLYLNDVDSGLGYELVAQTDIIADGSSDTRLVADTSASGTDWHGGGWSIGRGLYGGVHTDRFEGFIDEVRISNAALDPNEFLFYEESVAGVEVTPSDLVVPEDGTSSGELSVSLENLPAGDVTLTLEEQDGRGQVTLDPATLTFTVSNWNVPQSVSVTGVEDTVLENAEHQVLLAVSVASTEDSNYNGLAVDPVTVQVADNECGAWGYDIGDFNTDCVVDFADFVIFASEWLDCSSPDVVGCTDFSGM